MGGSNCAQVQQQQHDIKEKESYKSCAATGGRVRFIRLGELSSTAVESSLSLNFIELNDGECIVNGES